MCNLSQNSFRKKKRLHVCWPRKWDKVCSPTVSGIQKVLKHLIGFSLSPCYLPLSIVMTTCSSFTALGMMPLLLYIYTKGIYDGDLKDKVPYKGIMISLVMVLIPCSIGIFLKTKKPQYVPYIVKVRKLRALLK